MVLAKYKIGLRPVTHLQVIEEEDIKNYGTEEVEEEGDKDSCNKQNKPVLFHPRRRRSVVKKKTPTRTRRTNARLRTPITRKPLLQEEQLPQGQEGR